MSVLSEDKVARQEQRYAMLRVFGGTLFAFLALLVVALLVRPDLMQTATTAVMTMMH